MDIPVADEILLCVVGVAGGVGESFAAIAGAVALLENTAVLLGRRVEDEISTAFVRQVSASANAAATSVPDVNLYESALLSKQKVLIVNCLS